jgi:predicted transposase/invertase (TIGR01784 family)
MIAERNPQVKEAVVKLRRLSADEQARWEYEIREKARMDKDMFERWARTEGRQEEKLEIARNLLRIKLPLEQIIAITGLTREEVENLK